MSGAESDELIEALATAILLYGAGRGRRRVAVAGRRPTSRCELRQRRLPRVFAGTDASVRARPASFREDALGPTARLLPVAPIRCLMDECGQTKAAQPTGSRRADPDAPSRARGHRRRRLAKTDRASDCQPDADAGAPARHPSAGRETTNACGIAAEEQGVAGMAPPDRNQRVVDLEERGGWQKPTEQPSAQLRPAGLPPKPEAAQNAGEGAGGHAPAQHVGQGNDEAG